MALCAATSTHGYPDLHHPLQFRKAEALWKRDTVIRHNNFCACGDFLSHFKWPSTGGEGTAIRGEVDGEGGVVENTGEENITSVTMGEEEDIPDSELLM
uniref:ORF2 n=1 Tax=Torque teno Leptonychotes weddellii virus-1 TaxID=2012676 RepID=A0A1Z2RWR4_9VIRU|nr:ORF2 [Torque teno Leptonychotes weddellii virus 1]WCS65305.1 ORF2 [Torque teno Leptonychotes weddellii virus 1]